MSYEEEDICMSYEEADTFPKPSTLNPIHLWCMGVSLYLSRPLSLSFSNP